METSSEMATLGSPTSDLTMRLRYGFNETLGWRHFAQGPHREQLRERFRAMGTSVVRLLLFDPHGPDPFADWDSFAAWVQGVLDTGAVPMFTLSRFGPPYDEPQAVRWFAEQSADLVRRCIEQWGGEAVRDWFWCIWNQPNSDWVSAGMTFEHYRRIYEETATRISDHLAPYQRGRKPRIGGPAVDGFQPFWIDWLWRLVHEIDNALVGFVCWGCYGDWREPGTWGAPQDETVFETLLLARAAEYQSRARTVGRLLRGREMLNVCSELNAHSHHEVRVSGRFNQSVFGAVYYATALLHLIQGGADLEMFWTGTDDLGPYGVLDKAAAPTPVFHAKRLFAQHVRHGDQLVFPEIGPNVDAVVAQGEDGRQSVVLVHRSKEPARYVLSQLIDSSADAWTLLQIDSGTEDRVVAKCWDCTIAFNGYGIAVVTSAAVPVLDLAIP